ncbi:hypothetical protein APY94_01950 [Thermococcus celericrescens]|uniref:DUF2283 domain-containing protein n=2 Tax=Thermococcus celericrescens TaxID=227598 RepID=A0A100XZ29_9EURY|nr:hypothetical protein APY94_01950 [Thermococcus celericrescens]
MMITYDPNHDVMYIKFGGGEIVDTIEVGEGVLIDVGKDGRIIGIEIINASTRVGPNPLGEISIRLQEAAV